MTDQPARRRRLSRFQFSLGFLVLAITVLGPLLGIYGPTAYTEVRQYFWPDTEAVEAEKRKKQARQMLAQIEAQMKLLQFQRDQTQARIDALRANNAALRHNRWPADSVERGMQADLWETKMRLNAFDEIANPNN